MRQQGETPQARAAGSRRKREIGHVARGGARSSDARPLRMAAHAAPGRRRFARHAFHAAQTAPFLRPASGCVGRARPARRTCRRTPTPRSSPRCTRRTPPSRAIPSAPRRSSSAPARGARRTRWRTRCTARFSSARTRRLPPKGRSRRHGGSMRRARSRRGSAITSSRAAPITSIPTSPPRPRPVCSSLIACCRIPRRRSRCSASPHTCPATCAPGECITTGRSRSRPRPSAARWSQPADRHAAAGRPGVGRARRGTRGVRGRARPASCAAARNRRSAGGHTPDGVLPVLSGAERPRGQLPAGAPVPPELARARYVSPNATRARAAGRARAWALSRCSWPAFGRRVV